MTYESIKNHIAESRGELPLSAKNENGELVIIEERKDTDGNQYYRLTKTYYRLPNSTTMEYLMSHLNHSEGAVLKKGERVLIADLSWKGFVAGVYEMTETPKETGYGYIECRLDLMAMSEELFEDSGSAIEWALKQK